MCFGHNHRPDGPNGSPAGDPSTPDRSASGNTIYGHINDFSRTREEFGWSTAIARGWTALQIDCSILELEAGGCVKLGCTGHLETIVTIEAGAGRLEGAGAAPQGELLPLDAIRLGPDASASLVASTPMRVMQTMMYSPNCPLAHRRAIDLRRRNDHDWKLYEYEALGQEVFAPEYDGALGLLRFMFPQDEIPVHVHPGSGRIIRPISGRGYTYMHPDRCPMDASTIAAFDANVIHTNGPLKGDTYELWAVQLPWISSGIDTQNIAGHEQFVRYLSDVPVPARYKTRDGLLERARRQQARSEKS